MMTRRAALQVVAALVASQPQHPLILRLAPSCAETLEVDFGAGACTVHVVRLVQGALHVEFAVAELFAALAPK